MTKVNILIQFIQNKICAHQFQLMNKINIHKKEYWLFIQHDSTCLVYSNIRE